MPETCSRCGYFQCKCGLASYEKYGYMKSPSEKHRDKRRDLVATLQAELQTAKEELDKHRWIPVGERWPEGDKSILLCWRPIDWEKYPQHKEIIVGKPSYYDEYGKVTLSAPKRVWANGMFYDIETHITHWKPITLPKEDSGAANR